MLLAREPDAFRRLCDEARVGGKRVALVPTMGALHAGHARLISEAGRHADFVAVSVFVNPSQFGPSEDFSKYPRTLDKDMALAEEAGAALVFAPSDDAMYPHGDETRVLPGSLAVPLCGGFRPGHFEGVATVVTKLLVLAGRCVAVFGRKDYQQLRVVSSLVTGLFLPVEIVGVRTVRDDDGLAISSRNRYLSPVERTSARRVPLALSAAAAAYEKGERNAGRLRAVALEVVRPAATSIDYLEVADPDSLRLLTAGESAGERALLALAVRIGATRLIDNLVLGEESPPLPQGETARLLSAGRGA